MKARLRYGFGHTNLLVDDLDSKIEHRRNKQIRGLRLGTSRAIRRRRCDDATQNGVHAPKEFQREAVGLYLVALLISPSQGGQAALLQQPARKALRSSCFEPRTDPAVTIRQRE